MLDKFANRLLKKLNTISQNGEYKVIDKEELAGLIKDDTNAIDNNIKELASLGYIDIKYEDESVVCLCTLTKARQEIQQSEDKDYLNKKIAKIMFCTCLLSATFAFLGAFLATMIFG